VQLIGVVDDLRFGQASRGAVEVGRSAMRELEADEEALLLDYWQFTTGTGTTVFGNSGHDGELRGTADWVGFEGLPDLVDERKPRVWGTRRMLAPVWFDLQRLVCQANAGPTVAIVPLENGFASLTNPAGDFANIYDWTPVAGQYATQLSRGLVRFGSDNVVGGPPPNGSPGQLAFDVFEGTPSGSLIMRRWAVQAGVDPDTEIDVGAFDELADLRPGVVGYATGPGAVSIGQAMDDMATTLDAAWIYREDGIVTAASRALVAYRSEFDFELTDDDLDEAGPRKQSTAVVARSVDVGFRDHEVTLDLDEVAGSVPEDDRILLTRSTRVAGTPPLGRAFDDAHPEAEARMVQTLYDESGEARSDARRRLAVDQWPRDVYTFPLRHQVFRRRYRIGRAFLYTSTLFTELAGQVFAIVGLVRDPTTSKVELVGWAPTERDAEASRDAVLEAEDAAGQIILLG
jgi:hypothetical protein